MMAACFLDKGDTERAKHAASVSIEVEPSALSVAMLVRAHMVSNDGNALETGMERLLQCPDLSLSNALDLCFELRVRKHFQLALWALKQLEGRFSSDPSLGRARLEHLLLLQAIETEEPSNSRHAMQYAESIVTENLSGAMRLSPVVCWDVVRLCFNAGVGELRNENRQDAITWISHALALIPSQTAEDILVRAQFHRVLSRAYLEMEDVPMALNHATSAIKLAPQMAASWFLMARCQVKWNIQIKQAICNSPRHSSNAIAFKTHCKRLPRCMGAQIAMRRTCSSSPVWLKRQTRW
jgi:tetratricopeptide (TPR) repeat protein